MYNLQSNRKKLYAKIALTVFIVVLAVVVCISIIQNRTKTTYDRDLSFVVGLTFDMTMDDVIAFEKSAFGNTEYELSTENNRLDFAPYKVTEYSKADKYRHLYFFDKETGYLTKAVYRDITGLAECSHAKEFCDTLIAKIEKWDKETNKDLYKYAYGNINGEKCEIRYEGDLLYIQKVAE